VTCNRAHALTFPEHLNLKKNQHFMSLDCRACSICVWTMHHPDTRRATLITRMVQMSVLLWVGWVGKSKSSITIDISLLILNLLDPPYQVCLDAEVLATIGASMQQVSP
jgi:hypothetical protein